jgi:hypothetical protein
MQNNNPAKRNSGLSTIPSEVSLESQIHMTTHSCSCLCLGTPISSKVFGPALAGLALGVLGLGVPAAADPGVPTLLLLSAEGPGLGLEGVAESTLGGGRPRLELLFDVCGGTREECLPETGFWGAE